MPLNIMQNELAARGIPMRKCVFRSLQPSTSFLEAAFAATAVFSL